jgi:hypothetical protein
MFVVYALAIGLLVGRVSGGRLERLADLQFRWAPAAIAGLVAQLVLFAPPVTDALGGRSGLGTVLYVGSTGLVLGAVVRNVHLPGLALVAAGALLNLAAILANGGIMPTTLDALTTAGLAPATGFSNSALIADPALPWLVDRFGLPAWLPLANVFSVGDAVLGIGLAIAIAAGMHATARPGSREEAAGQGVLR